MCCLYLGNSPSYGERNKNTLSTRLRSGQRNAEWKQQTVRLQLLFLYQMKKFHTSKNMTLFRDKN